MTAKHPAAARVLALVDQTLEQGRAARRLAAALDVPGLPPRFAERAADAAVTLEELAVKLDAYFHQGR